MFRDGPRIEAWGITATTFCTDPRLVDPVATDARRDSSAADGAFTHALCLGRFARCEARENPKLHDLSRF